MKRWKDEAFYNLSQFCQNMSNFYEPRTYFNVSYQENDENKTLGETQKWNSNFTYSEIKLKYYNLK